MKHPSKNGDRSKRKKATASKTARQTTSPTDLPIPRSSSATSSSVSVAAIKTGDVVACFVSEYEDEEPQIATVVSIKPNSKLDVHWMHGSYSDPWLPCKRGRTMEPWVEEIDSTSLLYPIELTRTNRLSESVRKKLKLSYSKL